MPFEFLKYLGSSKEANNDTVREQGTWLSRIMKRGKESISQEAQTGVSTLSEEISTRTETQRKLRDLELKRKTDEAKRLVESVSFPPRSKKIAKYVLQVIRFETIQSLDEKEKKETLKQKESLGFQSTLAALWGVIITFFSKLFFRKQKHPTSEIGIQGLDPDILTEIQSDPGLTKDTINALKKVADKHPLRYVKLRLADIWTQLERSQKPNLSVPDFFDLQKGQFVAIVGTQKTHHKGKKISPLYTGAEGLITSLERRSDIHLGVITSKSPLLITEMSDSRMQTYPVSQIFEDYKGPYRVTSFQMKDYDPNKASDYMLNLAKKNTKFDHLFGAGSNAHAFEFGPQMASVARFVSRIFGGADKRVTCSEACSYALDVAKGKRIDPKNAAPNATYFAHMLGVEKSLVLDEDFIW